MSHDPKNLDLNLIGRSNSESIDFASDGSRWPDVHVYLRRGWADNGEWTVHVSHSSSSSTEELAKTVARMQTIRDALVLAQSFDTPEGRARLEANYQAARAEARAEQARLEAERQAKIDADPAMGQMNAADRVMDMIEAARANPGVTQTFFAQTRGERRRVKFTALRNHGTNMVFLKMAGQLLSKEKVIKALGNMSRELPEAPVSRIGY